MLIDSQQFIEGNDLESMLNLRIFFNLFVFGSLLIFQRNIKILAFTTTFLL